MNKGKVRDGVFAQRKQEAFNNLLKLKGKSKQSEYAKALKKKSGSELIRIYERERKK